MALSEEQTKWLTDVTGLQVIQNIESDRRAKKDLLKQNMSDRLANVKEDIRSQLSIKLKKGVFRSIKVLDEEGGQMEEYDISDYDSIKDFKTEYLLQMSHAIADIETFAKEMREATTPDFDEQGNAVLDEDGNPVMVPLYSEEEIAEEVYMPLVRERLMPEAMVPGKYSKTQEMIDASDAAYQERLIEYTKDLDENDQGLLDFSKGMVSRVGNLAQKAAAMVPAQEAELASAVIGLVTLGTNTVLTGVQVLSKKQLDDSANMLIDGIGQFMTGALETGLSAGGIDNAGDIAKLAGNSYTAAVTGAKVGVHLFKKPEPDFDKALETLGGGFDAAFGIAFAGDKVGLANANQVSKALQGTISQLFITAARASRAKIHLENGDTTAFINELAGAASGAVKAAGKIAADAQAGKQVDIDINQLSQQIADGIDAVGKAAVVGVKIKDALKARNLEQMADDLVMSLGDVLSDTLRAAIPGNPKIAETVSAAYTTTTSAGLVANYLTCDPPQPGKALQALGRGFGSALSMVDPENPGLRKAGDAIGTTLSAAGEAVLAKQAYDQGRYQDAVTGISNIGRTVIAKSFKVDVNDTGIEKDVSDALNSATDTLEEVAQSMAALQEKFDDEATVAEFERRLQERQTADAIAELESNRQDLDALLVQVDEGGRVAADARSIEKLIKAMIRDRMILEMAAKLATGGLAIVEKFVPTLGVGPAIQLVVNLTKAAERAMALNKWVGLQKDMHRAVSAFESSAQNFVKNQAAQFSHYTIQAALDVAKMIGEILEFAGAVGWGAGAVVGEAVSKSAALASAAEQISYDFYKKADLELAWRATTKAWKNPESRKLALVARKMNPTLAKYTLAWGAAVKKDAMAKEACAACGLNEMTLSNRNSNVHMVQKYLETCFPDDNVVLKRYEPAPEWMPAQVELTVKCWMTAKSRGSRVAEPKLKDVPTGAIDESLSGLVGTGAAYQQAVAEFQKVANDPDQVKIVLPKLTEAKDRHVAQLTACVKAFGGYQPVDVKNGPHHEMRGLVNQFRNFADGSLTEVELDFTQHVSAVATED